MFPFFRNFDLEVLDIGEVTYVLSVEFEFDNDRGDMLLELGGAALCDSGESKMFGLDADTALGKGYVMGDAGAGTA